MSSQLLSLVALFWLFALFLSFSFVLADLEQNLSFTFDDASPLQKVILPNGRCNDGSPGTYYYRRSSDPSNKDATWLIYFQGGGFCFDQKSCASRGNGDLTSSKGYADTRVPSGLLRLRQANIVYLPYCSSDDFTGGSTTNSSKDIWGNEVNWYFEGALITSAALHDLTSNQNFNAATRIVLSGSSAGAVALYAWADRLQNLKPSAAVLVFQDSGWFLDPIPFMNGTCADLGSCTEQEALERGVILWKSAGRLDADCEKALGSNNHLCLVGPHVFKYITTRWLIFEYYFDAAQLGHYGIYGQPAENTPALGYSILQAKNLTASLMAQSQFGKTMFAFVPSCFRHTIAESGGWTKLSVAGNPISTVVSTWIANNGVLPRDEVKTLFDECMRPECNPTCAFV